MSFCSSCSLVNTVIAGLGLRLLPEIIISCRQFPLGGPHRAHGNTGAVDKPPISLQLLGNWEFGLEGGSHLGKSPQLSQIWEI